MNRGIELVASCFLALAPAVVAAGTASNPSSPAAPSVAVVRTGQPEKVCQLAGDRDWETGRPTPGLAAQKFGVLGTALGSSFAHQRRLFFLFGDTWPAHGLKKDLDSDVLGMVVPLNAGTPTGAASDLCESFTFVPDAPGSYVQVRLDGHTLGTSEVPSSGFSTGDAMYVFFLHPVAGGSPLAVRATLGQSLDDGESFHSMPIALPDFFEEVSPVVVDAGDLRGSGLPWKAQPIVLFFAKRFERGRPYLAAAALGDIESPARWLYFAGLDAGGTPLWKAAADARPIVGAESRLAAGASGISVAWEPGLKRWLMLFESDAGAPPGIRMESAETPWGPWTATSELLVDAGALRCRSLYWPGGRDGKSCGQLDATADIPFLEHRPGRVYGAFLIPGYDEWDERTGTAHVYFTMSTFNPYTPLVLRAGLQLEKRSAPR